MIVDSNKHRTPPAVAQLHLGFAAMLRRLCRSADFGDGKSLDFYLAEHFDQRLIGRAVVVVVANCPAL